MKTNLTLIRTCLACCAGIFFLSTTACSSSPDRVRRDHTYETVRADVLRDTERAQKLNQRALELIEEDKLDEATKLLKDALTADITFGPAHNQLGHIYYKQQKYYLAAWEFQYAIKLMPHKAEPRNNLGLVFEKVGRLDEAITWYKDALDLQPENPHLIGNLARTRLRRGDRDNVTRELLSELLLRETRPEWRQWAQEKITAIGSPEPKPNRVEVEP